MSTDEWADNRPSGMLKRALAKAAVAAGIPAAILATRRGRLRILEYHAVCRDELAGAPWLPAFFVTASRFRRQMEFLRRRMQPLSLQEACLRLGEGTLPPRAVTVTLDDGYANNLHLAMPILAEFQVPATIFLATGSVETGAHFPSDRVRLLRDFWRREGRAEPPGCCTSADYLNRPIDEVTASLDRDWEAAGAEATEAQRDALRPLRRDELDRFDRSLVAFGAHTQRHCILRNETRERRDAEIARSVALVREWTGVDDVAFSYPNGQPGDFDEGDKEALRRAGVTRAVSCLRGSNGAGADRLQLRRYGLGLWHDFDIFRLEVCGLRSAALRLLGR